jgi:hypothetical protein
MAASDSFVGDGLNPSPYKEALARAERAEAERDALLKLLDEGRRLDAIGRHPKTHPESWRELKRDYDNRRDAALAKEEG